MNDFGAFTFYAQTVPGIEEIAWRELKAVSPDASLLGFRRIGQRNGMLIFEHRGPPKDLLQLKCTEDIFYLVAREQDVPPGRTGLRVIEKAIEASKFLDVGLKIHRDVRAGRDRRRPHFRVISRKEGPHRYRRSDVQKAVEKGILRRYNYRWQLVEDDADLEIWFTLLEGEAYYGLRLSDQTMRHRTYKLQHLPASLRPTVAYAMVLLSDPQPDDVFLDPMCGAGTILIERAQAGRYQLLLGGDIDSLAVEMCRENVGPRYKPIEIRQWDATQLPLEDGSVDKVVSNLPFGEQSGTHAENSILYPRFFGEMERVVRSGGRLVILSGEQQLMAEVPSQRPPFQLEESFDVLILGMPARIYLLAKS